jgi:hypothetical protein
MSVIRQANILGQQRIDVPHLRAIESSVCGDFDLLAGTIIGGRAPLVVKGFTVISAGAVTADQLQIVVADSAAVHFLATESGSIFNVPPDRAAEKLNSTNSRVFGTFVPGATNYVGVDFVRRTDDTTADLTMFMDATSEAEVPATVPLGRVLDYRIVISTRDFNSLPGVCPIARVVTDVTNGVTSIEDARNLFCRLGSGGSNPDRKHFYPWPAGRKESTTGDVFAGGDKVLTSLKSWMDATMTRLWEVGGGEYWYSPTADRNVRMVHAGSPFISTGEYFEWSGTHLHWQGLRVLFDNSTGNYNEVKDQTSNLAGLTDLLDGDCIYVDLDRTQNRSGGSALVAQKAPLTTLGQGTPPGARIVLAWRFGSQIFTRDQGYSVNSSFKVATVAANGTVRLSASAVPTPSTPVVAMVKGANSYQLFAGGISRGSSSGLNPVVDFIGGAGAIVIGGGTMDQIISLQTTRTQDYVEVTGRQVYGATGDATLLVSNQAATLAPDNRIAAFQSYNSFAVLFQDAVVVESSGALGFRNVDMTNFPTSTPVPTAASPIRAKLFFKTNGLTTPDTRDQLCVMWFDGTITPIAEGPSY